MRHPPRADVRMTIKALLDKGLPVTFEPNVYQEKTEPIVHHIYECYFGAGKSAFDRVE